VKLSLARSGFTDSPYYCHYCPKLISHSFSRLPSLTITSRGFSDTFAVGVQHHWQFCGGMKNCRPLRGRARPDGTAGNKQSIGANKLAAMLTHAKHCATGTRQDGNCLAAARSGRR